MALNPKMAQGHEISGRTRLEAERYVLLRIPT